MCGIAGIWNSKDGNSARPVKTMLDAMKHRGPDGRGMMEWPGGAAGMVRLALVDLSDAGQQPIWSPKRDVAILFNGEMYNFRAERSRLAESGYMFRSASDTEVALALYLQKGTSFVEHLRGMFALAILDFRGRSEDAGPRLVLARDPFGIKPLYIAERGASVTFSSELRPLVRASVVEPRVSAEGLMDFLAHGFVLQPHTMLDGVRMLGAGTLEVLEKGSAPVVQRFWHLPPEEPRETNLVEAGARLRATLEESVALHAWADTPVGVFLSGGLDSTLLATLMKARTPDLRSYTLRFPDAPGSDEADVAMETARRLGTKHTSVDVTSEDVARDLPAFANSIDQPSIDGFNTWLVSRAAARDVKGVVSGLGADEWFAGYPVTGRMVRLSATARGLLSSRVGAIANVAHQWLPLGGPQERAGNLAARRSPSAMWVQAHRNIPSRRVRRLLGLADRDDTLRLLQVDPHSSGLEREGVVGLSLRLDSEVFMRSQLLRDSDATSMAHSLELRVPFVDVNVAAFARSCHPDLRIAEDSGVTRGKRVLFSAARGLVPEDTLNRPKRGFVLPHASWLAGPLWGLLHETAHPDAVARRGLVDPNEWKAIWGSSNRRGLAHPVLWSMMILELWARAVLDAPARMGPP